MELTRVDAIVQFTAGTTSVWNNVSIPVPSGAVVIDTVNKVIKEGDGSTLFADLPVCLDYDFNSETSGAVIPLGDHVGTIAIADDSLYSPGNTKLANILNDIIGKNTKSAMQQDRINVLTLNNLVAEVSEGAAEGTLVICNGGKYTHGNRTLGQLINDLVASANTVVAGMHIGDLNWYSDSELKNPVIEPNKVTEKNTYWCEVTGFHDVAEMKNVDFAMTSTTPGVTVYSDRNEESCGIIEAIYGGNYSDYFIDGTIDNEGNIIAVGYTYSEGIGSSDKGNALIVKLDSDLNILNKKIYGGLNNDQFNRVVVDSDNNIVVVGDSLSEGSGGTTYGEALIVKFDDNLSILARKQFGGNSDDRFSGVTVDNQNNIIAVGTTLSEGLGGATGIGDALIVKFDKYLNTLNKKIYSGSNQDNFTNVVVDNDGNIICSGWTVSEGIGNVDLLLIKFDHNLSIIYRKRYGNINSDFGANLTVDNAGNIYVTGSSTPSGWTKTAAMILKFDKVLNLIHAKNYGVNTANHYFYGINIDSNNNVICCGYAYVDGYNKGIITKFDSSLNLIASKTVGITGGNDGIRGVIVDHNDNLIFVGYVKTNEYLSGYILKIPNNFPTGTLVGTVFTNISLSDVVNLSLTTMVGTLANSTLTLADSTLVSSNSTLNLADSNLTLEKDVIVATRYTEPTQMITTVYSADNVDKFIATTIDGLGNIVAVGSSVVGGSEIGLIVKFDSEFVTLARKVYSGNYSEYFTSVITDDDNNIICVGNYNSNLGGLYNGFITKFSSDLASIIIQKNYGATGDDIFNDIAKDSSGNYYVVGYTTSEGSGLKDGLVVKFDSNFNISYKKRYGGTGNEILNSVALDVNGNIICVGYTTSEGANTSGLVLKLDSYLNIVLRKIYNSTLGTTTNFNSVTVTTANVIYCAGHVVTATGNKALLVKFDSNINTTGSKLYGNSIGDTEFTGIKTDSNGDVICVGKTSAEGAGGSDALVVKFSSSLAIKGRKTYGTIGMDADIDCSITSDDSIIMSGYGLVGGSTDAMITKLPKSLPVGLYTNKYITDLILSDSKLILSDDVGIVGNSTLAMAESLLILSNSSMLISNASGAITTDKTIMDAISNIFKVKFDNVVTSGETAEATFNIVTNDGAKQVAKNIKVNVNKTSMILSVFDSGYADWILWNRGVDSNGNIFVAGYTFGEGTGSPTSCNALILKLDSNLNILARKLYSGGYNDFFSGCIVDHNNNVICVGYTRSVDNNSSNSALIVKFDNNLNVLFSKSYNGSVSDLFNSTVIDSNNNIYVVGNTTSEGQGGTPYGDALIIKFDSSLNILARKIYGGTGDERFNSITIDSNDNVFAVGWTSSEGQGGTPNGDALIIKFDSNLNIINRKIYGSVSNDYFYDIHIDSNDNVFVSGSTDSKLLLVKFDNNLNLIKSKTSGDIQSIAGLIVDYLDNVIIAGAVKYTNVSNIHSDSYIIKMDNDFNIIDNKIFMTVDNSAGRSLMVDGSNNIYMLGRIAVGDPSNTSDKFYVLKVNDDIPSGTVGFVNNPDYVLMENPVTLIDANLTLANSNLTLANSNLTLANITTFTLTNSTAVIQTREVVTI